MADVQKVASGIPGLDDLIEGGFWPKSTVVILGSSGTGKSTFAIQFLMEGIEQGEQALYVTLEEPPEQIMREADLMGFDMRKYYEKSITGPERTGSERSAFSQCVLRACSVSCLAARFSWVWSSGPANRGEHTSYKRCRFFAWKRPHWWPWPFCASRPRVGPPERTRPRGDSPRGRGPPSGRARLVNGARYQGRFPGRNCFKKPPASSAIFHPASPRLCTQGEAPGGAYHGGCPESSQRNPGTRRPN